MSAGVDTGVAPARSLVAIDQVKIGAPDGAESYGHIRIRIVNR